MRQSESQPGSNGFTLIELLVVLGILGLSLAIVPPLLGNAIESSQYKSTVRELVSGLRLARSQAITAQQESVLTLNVKDRSYRLDGSAHTLDLPDDTSIELTAAHTEQISDDEGGIRFFADGSSSGGQIQLTMGQLVYTIDVNWLTGKVSIFH